MILVQNCLRQSCDGQGCQYIKFDTVEFSDCDIKLLELDTKIKYVRGNCTDTQELGSFSFCTGLLKNSYDIAKICSCAGSTGNTTASPTTTTKVRILERKINFSFKLYFSATPPH